MIIRTSLLKKKKKLTTENKERRIQVTCTHVAGVIESALNYSDTATVCKYYSDSKQHVNLACLLHRKQKWLVRTLPATWMVVVIALVFHDQVLSGQNLVSSAQGKMVILNVLLFASYDSLLMVIQIDNCFKF